MLINKNNKIHRFIHIFPDKTRVEILIDYSVNPIIIYSDSVIHKKHTKEFKIWSKNVVRDISGYCNQDQLDNFPKIG